MSDSEQLAKHLHAIHSYLLLRGIQHRVIYGTLLGAVRDRDIISWDYDFDLLAEREDRDALLALNEDMLGSGYRIDARYLPSNHLAMNRNNSRYFDSSSLAISYQGKKVGDIYLFALFNDGVLRLFDFETDSYWCPRSSFPEFFLESCSEVSIRGKLYPGIGHPEKFLQGVYGDDWREPYRAVLQGGEPKAGVSTHGDVYEPKLKAEIEWCLKQGWDQSVYSRLPAWPRYVGGAGPIGPTPRTENNSRSMWWRSFEELTEYY